MAHPGARGISRRRIEGHRSRLFAQHYMGALPPQSFGYSRETNVSAPAGRAQPLAPMTYNGRMRVFELTEALSEVPGIEVKVRRGALHIHVPALGDTASLDPDEVTDAADVYVPTQQPAVQLDIRQGREILPLIVTVDDLVFTPAYADDLIAEGADVLVPAMPSLIAYSEMHRDVRALGKAVDENELDPRTLAATLIAHRCFLRGAIRMGLWPVRVAAWWEYTNARVAHTLDLPPFREDPAWDQLLADVTAAREKQTNPDTVRG
jgi:hypothetical protein